MFFLLLLFLLPTTQALPENSSCLLELPYEEVVFENEQPIFPTIIEDSPEKILWQISKDPFFESPIREEEEIFTSKVVIEDCIQTLETNEDYYFRIKPFDKEVWSKTCRFQIHFSDDFSETLFTKKATSFYGNSYISNEIWKNVFSYLLPAENPARPILDQIFSKSRVTENVKAMKAAGFDTKGPGHWSKTVFARHKKLKSYVVKMIGDDQNISEIEKFTNRIEGANTAREIIDRYGFHHLMKVPRKWLYALPQEPAPIQGSFRKNFILVEDDMKIYPSKKNFAMWKSDSVTKELLDAVYILITEGGFNDSVQVFNIPFSEDGRIAIIDTELHHKWPVHYNTLSKFLDREMREYWQMLIDRGGPLN